jgi:hypothetical protein
MCTHVAEALGGAAEGSYQQEAAAVGERRGGARGRTRDGEAKEAGFPEWAELYKNRRKKRSGI